MIKLICGIFFLMITSIHASEYLEDINLEKTKKVLLAARASGVSDTIYNRIYAKARSFVALKGTDAESLFLNLYFSACFLEHKTNLELNPEKLSDNLYRCMLEPLEGNLNGMFLTALDLTGILSRVNGMFQAGPREITIDPQKLCDTAFSRLITARGRFGLVQSTEERKRQLVIDIYRHYNLNDPMFGMASQRHGAAPNVDLLWSEIVGGSLEPAKRAVLDPTINSIQEHALNCFIVAYFASHSPEYRLSDYETSRASLFEYLVGKLGKSLQRNESQWNNHFRYFYDIVSSQITSDGIRHKVLSAFYDANVQQNAQRNARLNQQFDILRQFDISIPHDRGDGIFSLNTYLAERRFDHLISEDFLAHSLGVLSFQTGLTSYFEWIEMLDLLKSNINLTTNIKLKLWEKLEAALLKNPLRKSLFSIIEERIEADKVIASYKRDQRYSKEKTLTQVEKEKDLIEKAQQEHERKRKLELENERKKAENAIKRQQNPWLADREEREALYVLPQVVIMPDFLIGDWNIFRELHNIIVELKTYAGPYFTLVDKSGTEISSVRVNSLQEALWQTRFMPLEFGRPVFKKTEFRKAYKKLALNFHPDKNGSAENSPYNHHFACVNDTHDSVMALGL